MIKNFTHFTPTEITHIKGKINSVGILQKVFPEIWEEILCESNPSCPKSDIPVIKAENLKTFRIVTVENQKIVKDETFNIETNQNFITIIKKILS